MTWIICCLARCRCYVVIEQVAYCLIISESDLALVFNAHLDIDLAGNDDTAILLVFNQ